VSLQEAVVEKIKACYDPEIPVNVYDLGLVYDVRVEAPIVTVQMTFTSESCPSARDIPLDVRRRVLELDEIDQVDFMVVWEPPWHPRMISEDARRELGIDDDALEMM
jgi:metal-sulfur cluster biosynthetic enzyme